MPAFDEYVSLGNRCETAFQIQRVLGKENLYPSFFNWNVTYFDSLVTLLGSRFAGILEYDNLNPTEWLVHDLAGDYLFHLVGEGRRSKEHPEFVVDLENHRSKVAHIIDRYFTLTASEKQVCYFYRTEECQDTLRHAMRVRDILREIHKNDNFAVVFVQPEELREPAWQEELVYNRYVTRFAANDDQADGHIQSWDRVFREFCRAGPMRFCDWL